jgi:hypothetical protein
MFSDDINEYDDSNSVKDNAGDDVDDDAAVRDNDNVDEDNHEGGCDNDDDAVVKVEEDDANCGYDFFDDDFQIWKDGGRLP